MVRAIIAGRKTQTRRLMKDQTSLRIGPTGFREIWTGFMGWETVDWALANRGACGKGVLPRIASGDRVWVRESVTRFDKGTCDQHVWYRAGKNFLGLPDDSPYRELGVGENDQWPKGREGPGMGAAYSVPSIHMPKWASRLTLLVDNVRIERLQDCSEADAIAEGIEFCPIEEDGLGGWKCYAPEPKGQDEWSSPYHSYRTLWDSINGPGAWRANPWIVAYTFRVVLQNIDQIEKVAA